MSHKSVEDGAGDPVVVVSNDTHIGPRLVEDLRDYCPSSHLDEFDRFAATTAAEKDAAAGDARGQRLPRPSRTSARPATTTPPPGWPTTTTTASPPA